MSCATRRALGQMLGHIQHSPKHELLHLTRPGPARGRDRRPIWGLEGGERRKQVAEVDELTPVAAVVTAHLALILGATDLPRREPGSGTPCSLEDVLRIRTYTYHQSHPAASGGSNLAAVLSLIKDQNFTQNSFIGIRLKSPTRNSANLLPTTLFWLLLGVSKAAAENHAQSLEDCSISMLKIRGVGDNRDSK